MLLGSLERPALKWLAAHQPDWVNPDMMTGVGVLGAVVVFSGYCLSNIDKNFLWLASLGFVINWYGDSLDGTLARYRNIQKPKYGYFIDHTVDSFNEVLIFVGLGLSPYLHLDIACLTLIGYLLMSILVFVRTGVTGVFQISYARVGPTELRLIAILANTGVYFFGNPSLKLPFGVLSVYDLIALTLAILLIIVFIVSTIIQARELADIDQPINTDESERINLSKKLQEKGASMSIADLPADDQ
jgi:phosphatidylglycerophosphate synthase